MSQSCAYNCTGLIVILNLVYAYYYPQAFKSLLNDANEVGDFLAGTAGTLALVWLIVGYFLQREELKLNTKALHGQKSELKNQAEEYKKLIKVTLRQVIANESLVKMNKSEFIKAEQRRIESVKPIFSI